MYTIHVGTDILLHILLPLDALPLTYQVFPEVTEEIEESDCPSR